MPAYDFRCVECRHVCEITRAARDDSPVACPVCGSPTKQVWHPVGVHFKGSGFYSTDSKPAASSEESATSACPVTSTSESCKGCPSAE